MLGLYDISPSICLQDKSHIISLWTLVGTESGFCCSLWYVSRLWVLIHLVLWKTYRYCCTQECSVDCPLDHYNHDECDIAVLKHCPSCSYIILDDSSLWSCLLYFILHDNHSWDVYNVEEKQVAGSLQLTAWKYLLRALDGSYIPALDWSTNEWVSCFLQLLTLSVHEHVLQMCTVRVFNSCECSVMHYFKGSSTTQQLGIISCGPLDKLMLGGKCLVVCETELDYTSEIRATKWHSIGNLRS